MRRHLYHLPAIIDRVIDGDSMVVHLGVAPGLELHGIHVRVARINAPELKHAGGTAARDFAKTLLPEGTEVMLVSSQEDKYGRLLASIELPDGGDFAFKMLDAGHAAVSA